MPTVRRIAFAALLPVLLIASVIAETRAQPETLSVAQLLEDTSASMTVFTALRDTRAEVLDRERAIRVDVDRLAVEIQAVDVPAAPNVSEPPTGLEATRAIADQWALRTEAQETLVGLLSERLALLNEHQQIALRLAHESDLMIQALSEAMPYLTEVEARVEAGEIATEEDLAIVDGLTVRITQAGLADDSEGWRALAQRSVLEEQRAEQALAAIEEAISEEEPAVALVERWLQEATIYDLVRQEWADQPLGDVLAALSNRVIDFETTFEDLRSRIRETDRLSSAVEEAEAELDALFQPDVEDLSDADGIEASMIVSLERARENMVLAESVVAYFEAKHELLEQLQRDLVATLEADQAIANALESGVTEAMEMSVLAELLEESSDGRPLPSSIQDIDFASQMQTLREARTRLDDRIGRFSARVDSVAAEVAQASQDLLEARGTLTDRRHSVEREESWATYITELQSEDSDALVDIFLQTNAQFEDANQNLAQLAQSVDDGERATDEASTALSDNVDPAALIVREQTEAFDQFLADHGLRIEADPTDVETAADPGATAADDGGSGAAASESGDGSPVEGGEASEPSRTPVEVWLDELHHFRDEVAVRRIAYYETEAELRDALIADLRTLRDRLDAYVAEGEPVLDSARRAWGAANILSVRERRGDIEMSALPEEMANWESRDALQLISDDIDAARRDLQRVDRHLAALEEAVDLRTIQSPLEDWQENLGIRIEELEDYQSLQAHFEAIEDVESLGELERQMLERSIQARIAGDLGVYSVLDDFFASAETETIDELLHRFYERLVQNENRAQNTQDRQDLVVRMVEQTLASRETLVSLREILQAIVEEAERALDVETTRILAALNPADAPTLIADLAERRLVELDPATIPSLPRDGDEDTTRAARNDLILSLLDDWVRVVGYRQWAAEIDGMTQPLGGIDRDVEGLQSLSARLEATRHDIERSISRLVGYSPQELRSLLQTQSDLRADQRRQLARGEIGTLRDQREGIIDSTLVQSLIALVVIPLIALVIVLVIRWLGGRYIRNVERTRAGEAGAKERAETLNGIFQTIVVIAAIALAVIYMFQAVNVDVTPLLASLGIFGLAVAFGAQSIIKDLFSGFFLLMENQFNRGDWVVINGEVGQIESLGLRLTAMRDWPSGTLHYFPNGSIQSVENYNKEWNKSVVEVKVPWEYDPYMVRSVIQEAIDFLKSDTSNEKFYSVLKDLYIGPGLGAHGMDYELGAMVFPVHCEGYNVTGSRIAGEFRSRVNRVLHEKGIPLALPRQIEIRHEGEASGS